MARTRFTQADITRAFKGATAAGVVVQRVEIDPDGKVIVFPENGSGAPAGANDWDKK